MSIADKIQRLSDARDEISAAITAKGGTVASGDGFEDFADDIETIATQLPAYEGSYTVTPLAVSTTLQTANKTATDNFVFEAVPYAEVSNPSGGMTVSILS